MATLAPVAAAACGDDSVASGTLPPIVTVSTTTTIFVTTTTVQKFYIVKRGDTLGKIAKKYGVSVLAIKRANRLKNSLIREKRTYLIPVARSRPAAPGRRLTIPPRRLPPADSAAPRAVSSSAR